jgi:hypothetical protein
MDTGTSRKKDRDGNVSTEKKMNAGLHEPMAETESVIRLDEKLLVAEILPL